MSKYLGGYKLISLGNQELSTITEIKGIYDAILESKKRIVLTDIVLNGQKMNDLTVLPFVADDLSQIEINDVYGHDIIVSDDNTLEIHVKTISFSLVDALEIEEEIDIQGDVTLGFIDLNGVTSRLVECLLTDNDEWYSPIYQSSSGVYILGKPTITQNKIVQIKLK